MTKTHRPSPLTNQKGFTLIEIIAVLVILGILAAVAVPKFMDLQDDARAKSAQAAISEVKARLSTGYGKYLLKNSNEKKPIPTKIADICGKNGVNDKTILPIRGKGDVPMGADYKVSLAPKGSNGTITVTQVQGQPLKPNVTDTWIMPN